jgi:ABC-type sugar transport system permease subunit
MLDFNLGIINELGLRLGLFRQPIAWLSRPDTAMVAVMLAIIWQGFPFFAVTLLAGLQGIPNELYEAASLDGAGAAGKFWHVTLPGLTGVIATALLLRTIWVANSLDLILVMTGGGGYRYPDASAPCNADRLVRRRLWKRLSARRHPHPDSAGWHDLLLKETGAVKRRLKTLLGTELPMLAVLAFALGPWFWMLLSSLRPERDLTRTPLVIWPSTLTLAHHLELLKRTSFLENLRDSLIVAAGTVIVGLALALPAAYAFSRFRFRGRTTMRSLFLIINMFPIVMLILPLFILLRQLRLLDTYFALISRACNFHTAVRDLAFDKLYGRDSH